MTEKPRARVARGHRMILALLMSSAIINFMDRGALSVAAPPLAAEFSLHSVQLGVLLSAFFWSYAAFQIPAGWLVDRFSATWVFGLGFGLWSVATLGSGLALGIHSLMAWRVLLGMGEAVAFPCYSGIIATRFAIEQRGLPNALVEAGTKIGPALGSLIGGLLVARYGWRVLFLGMGVGSSLWLVPWLIWGTRPPPVAEQAPAAAAGSPGLLRILARRDAWGTFLGSATYTYAYFFLLTWLPSYLVRVRHVSLTEMAFLSSVPFWAAAAAVASGWLSDRWIRRGGSPTRVRKTFVTTGLLLSTVMVGSVYVPSLTLSIVLLSLAYVAFGVFASNHWAISQTLAGPGAAGQWTGIQNMFGGLTGIAAPILTGVIVARTGSFVWAFLTPALLAVVGAAAYLFLVGPVAPLNWQRGGAEAP